MGSEAKAGCPFKVGDRVRYKEEIRGNWPEATVTELTERGFKYEYDEPYVLGTRIGSSPGGEAYESSFSMWERVPGEPQTAAPAQSEPKPLDMLLFCPQCGEQHIDEPQPEKNWDNPPHKSHACQFCGCIWRPADRPTNGVLAIASKGGADTHSARPRFYKSARDFELALASLQEAAPCEWKYDDIDNLWQPSCGDETLAFCFSDEGPLANKMTYCFNCTGKIKEVRIQRDDTE